MSKPRLSSAWAAASGTLGEGKARGFLGVPSLPDTEPKTEEAEEVGRKDGSVESKPEDEALLWTDAKPETEAGPVLLGTWLIGKFGVCS